MTGINFVYFMILKWTYHFGQPEQNCRWVFDALHAIKNDLPKFHDKKLFKLKNLSLLALLTRLWSKRTPAKAQHSGFKLGALRISRNYLLRYAEDFWKTACPCPIKWLDFKLEAIYLTFCLRITPFEKEK